MSNVTKSCTNKDCDQINPQSLSRFHKNKNYKGGFHYYCKYCCRSYANKWNSENRHKRNTASKEWAKKNPRKRNENWFKWRYKIDLSQYENMVIQQNNQCFICKIETKLFVDHNHSNGQIRALLCRHCNTALGFAKEDIQILSNMIYYIKQFNIGALNE